MRFAFYTDMHHAGQSPARRKDYYPEAVERKHRFIYKDAQERGADFFLFGGDMNEYHTVAYSVVNRQFEIMREMRKVDEYAIIGNHDVVGNNSDRVGFVPISTLYSSGFLKRLHPEEPTIIEQGGIRVAIFGRDIHKDMDNLRPEDYYVKRPDGVDFVILVAHGWLREKEMNIEGVRHTTFAQVVATGTEADIILTGHDHKGHPTADKTVTKVSPVTHKPILFVNPGSPVRIKAAEYEMERQVGYMMFDLGAGTFSHKFVVFPDFIARPAEEVLDREALLKDLERAEERAQMERQYENFSLSSLSPKDVIIEIAAEENISSGAREDLITRIEDEEIKAAQKALTYTT